VLALLPFSAGLRIAAAVPVDFDDATGQRFAPAAIQITVGHDASLGRDQASVTNGVRCSARRQTYSTA
jgi:hypothetical protein